MLYDLRLRLRYDYDTAAGGSRHQLRVMPANLPGIQRVVAASLSFAPQPTERLDRTDFFGNAVTAIAYRDFHAELDVRMSARVAVTRPEPGLDVTPDMRQLGAELAAVRSLAPDSPHHFLSPSEHAAPDDAITGYARISAGGSVAALAMDLCRRIHRDFAYDSEATDVRTQASDAFRMRRGVCQDFAHIMIAGLRGIGVPAGYVSGFLRTIPPPGKDRLEGADAMHAWVKVWAGQQAGWLEFDPTNGIGASNDHIVAGYGRDYSDVAPIVGILKTTGGQSGDQAVDVIPVAAAPV